ncbi:MAG: sulfite exporter TauE/SafE family protein [Ancrocorticia sp.]|uniref:sulfite exporter TauE/SafE family protein n=1 Tax=Ancrocorticia sp. TaxID=2593684 RepID=UPI003F8E7CC4
MPQRTRSHQWQRRRKHRRLPTPSIPRSKPPSNQQPSAAKFGQSRIARWIYGFIGSFTTMVANSGGPPMTMYFLASGFDMVRFLGTQAWFFFVVNLAKLPFQGILGLHSAHSLATDLLLLPTVIVGALLGRLVIARINPAIFNPLVIGLSILSAVYLLF